MRTRTILLLAVLLGAAPAGAADYYWNPGSATGNWEFNANWSIGSPGTYTSTWSDSNTANFSGANQTVTVNSFITIAGINFTANGITVVSGSGASDLRVVGTVPVSVSGTNTATISESLISIGAGSALVKQGNGTLVLGGANTVTTINVAAGTLRLGSATGLGAVAGSSAGLVVDGTLDLAGFSPTRGPLTGLGLITNTSATAATLTVGNATTATFGGAIQNGAGTVSLAKTGTGTQFLSATSTYSGTTTISGGALYINGTKTGSGAVDVTSNATLGGTGSIAGNTTLTSGILEIGSGATAIGSLTLTGNVAATGSTARFHFNRTGGNTAGAGYDQLTVGGTIDLTGLTLDAVVNSNGGTNAFTTMTILDAGAGNLSGTFNGLAHGDAVTGLDGFAGSPTWFIRYDYANGDVTLSTVPVPEPAFGAVVFAFAIARGVRRRRFTKCTC